MYVVSVHPLQPTESPQFYDCSALLFIVGCGSGPLLSFAKFPVDVTFAVDCLIRGFVCVNSHCDAGCSTFPFLRL